MKPIWKSRKLVYSLGTVLAALVLTFLPQLVTLDPETEALLSDVLPMVFVIGLSLIAGHTVTDLMALWKEGVAGKPLAEALHDLIDAIQDALDGERPIEDLEEIKSHIRDLLAEQSEGQG